MTVIPQLKGAARYLTNRGVSPLQAFLKHSLIPLGHINSRLPKRGTVLDLGCGEGMFSNLIANTNPHLKVIGIDKDASRVNLACRNAPENASFFTADFFSLPPLPEIDAVILNDVTHHLPFGQQTRLLLYIRQHLADNAVIFLKEVDLSDKADRLWTSFFDRKLYPEDTLCFRTQAEWVALLSRTGYEVFSHHRVRHPWPASRTVLAARFTGEQGRKLSFIDNKNDVIDKIRNSKTSLVNILITGGTGFIGSHLIEHLLARGIHAKQVRLLVLARNPSSVPEHLRNDSRVIILPGDLEDTPCLLEGIPAMDVVFHLAAEVKFSGGSDVWRNNFKGTESLLKALKDSQPGRLIYASTIGAVERKFSDSCLLPIHEGDEPNPSSDYGKAKLKAEELVRNSGIDYTIARITWAYGPNMTPDTHVRFLMQSVYDNKPSTRFNFPGRVSLVAVEDVVRSLVFLAEHSAAKNETFFIADDNPVPLGRLFSEMADIMGLKRKLINLPGAALMLLRKSRRHLPLTIQSLSSDVLWADNNRLKQLGFMFSTWRRVSLHKLARSIGLSGINVPMNANIASIITGAASGIGKAVAEKLCEGGHRLILIDRDAEALEGIAARLRAEHLCLDLTSEGSTSEIAAFVRAGNFVTDYFVNNAGIGAKGAFESIPVEKQTQCISLNCTSFTRIAHLALSEMKRHDFGTLINITSSSAFQPLPFMAVYAASKAFALSLSRSLASEMSHTGIRVLSVIPSGTRTAFQQKAGVRTDTTSLLSPAYVAERILKAATTGKSEVVIGASGLVMNLAARILPASIQLKAWRKLMIRLR